MSLPNDYTRCDGTNWDECRDCQRRTAPRPDFAWVMVPPMIAASACEHYIEPDDSQ